MRRGDVWRANLLPVIGSEADRSNRPVVIVSNDGRNQVSEQSGRGVITVVPLTSNVKRVFDFQVFISADERNGLTLDSKAQAEQIRAIDVSRLGERIGELSTEHLAALDDALLLHLAL